MNRVALLIGGNQGDRSALIAQATELIQQRIGPVVAASRVYETEPWGEFDSPQPNFLNRGLLVETALTAHEVLSEALEIEAELGRVRKEGSKLYSSRPMDIDLIFYNDEVIETPELTIPHPRMHLRQFVLDPLAEIMPEYRHPVMGLTVREMLINTGVKTPECKPVTPCGGSQNNNTPHITGVETPACKPGTHYGGYDNNNIRYKTGVETPACKPNTHYMGYDNNNIRYKTGLETPACKPNTHYGGSDNNNIRYKTGVAAPACKPGTHYVGSDNNNIRYKTGVETPACKPNTPYGGSKKQ
jgi:2-amino-4-hydroxy-6-hydroxymethyldihydropteridine diphosphokinase